MDTFSQEAFVTDEEEIGDDLEQVEALQSKFDAYQRVSPRRLLSGEMICDLWKLRRLMQSNEVNQAIALPADR